MEWVETNGVVLRYELSGAGRVPLLLIHELGGSLEFWDPVLPAFQQAFRVLRYDLRGFGMSEKGLCMESFANSPVYFSASFRGLKYQTVRGTHFGAKMNSRKRSYTTC